MPNQILTEGRLRLPSRLYKCVIQCRDRVRIFGLTWFHKEATSLRQSVLVQALLILRGQVPGKKRGKSDNQAMEAMDDDSMKNQGWPISGPFDLQSWRQAVER